MIKNISEWIFIIILASFFKVAADLFLSDKNFKKISGTVKFVFSIILVLLVIFPIINLIADFDGILNDLYIKFNIENIIDTEENNDVLNKLIVTTTIEKFEEGIFRNIENKFERSDFEVFTLYHIYEFETYIDDIYVYYDINSDFPYEDVKIYLKDLLNFNVIVVGKG